VVHRARRTADAATATRPSSADLMSALIQPTEGLLPN
jgi:hypothetical protein